MFVFCLGVILIYIKMSDNSHVCGCKALTFFSLALYINTFQTVVLVLNMMMKINTHFIMLQMKHNTVVHIWNVAYLLLGIHTVITENTAITKLMSTSNGFWVKPETCYNVILMFDHED